MNKPQNNGKNQVVAWSVGHSNVPYAKFVKLLKSAGIGTVIDCRTKPFSRWPQYVGFRLQRLLADDDITYEFRGSNLGGLGGNVYYDETLDELQARAAGGEQIALLCSEAKPQDCHRGTKLTPDLEARGVTVKHLLYEAPQRSLL